MGGKFARLRKSRISAVLSDRNGQSVYPLGVPRLDNTVRSPSISGLEPRMTVMEMKLYPDRAEFETRVIRRSGDPGSRPGQSAGTLLGTLTGCR
jgi:hypothetical protein